MSIRIGILGYGNLGRGVESAVRQNPDMELIGVFTRRDPSSVKTAGAKVFHTDEAVNMKDQIDVMILCGKGHEEYQVIGDDYMEFSEHKIIKELTKGMVE